MNTNISYSTQRTIILDRYQGDYRSSEPETQAFQRFWDYIKEHYSGEIKAYVWGSSRFSDNLPKLL